MTGGPRRAELAPGEREITPDLLRNMPLPQPGDGGKEERGRLIVVGGSTEMPGAALLAGTAALRVGAGKLRIATSRSIAPQLALAMPEGRVYALDETADGSPARWSAADVVKAARGCQAILVGPGMAEDADTFALAAALLEDIRNAPFVIDAAPLACLQQHRDLLRRHDGRIIITPHAGEMATILDCHIDRVKDDPLACARDLAAELGVVVIMKGACSHVVTPQGRASLYREGCVGLATSGSGDVLAGTIVGLLARGADPEEAAIWAVYLHGEAGSALARKVGPMGFLARELPGEFPRLMSDKALPLGIAKDQEQF